MPKFPEITLLRSSFLQNQALTCSLENSTSKQVFLENYREDPENVFKKDSAVAVLLESFQKIFGVAIYRSTKGRLLLKIQAAKKIQNPNRRLWVNK